MKRLQRSAAIVCATLGATAAGGVTVAAAAGALPAPATAAVESVIAWGTCDSDPDLRAVHAECGYLSVPLDYEDPDGRKIDIAVSRMRAKGPAEERQGPLLVNFGGPGGAGLYAPAQFEDLPEDIRNAYDIVGFDPRGVGVSVPALECGFEEDAPPAPDFVPTTGPLEAPGIDEQKWRDRALAYATACEDAHGDVLPYLRSTNVVKDMDAIRAALGATSLNFWGFSYGTYLGQLYATTYPDRTRRFILDGNVDPSTWGYQGSMDQARSFEETVQRLWAWIAEHNGVYYLGTTADEVDAKYYRIADELRKDPQGPVGPLEWNLLFINALYNLGNWPSTAEAFAEASKGNYGPVARALNAAAGAGPGRSSASPAQSGGLNLDAFTAVTCSDARWPRDPDRLRADAFALAVTAPFSAWGTYINNLGCAAWPVQGKRATVSGALAPPLLLASTTVDPATPFLNSLNVRLQFPNAALVSDTITVGHTATHKGNPCVDEVVNDYLRTGTLPQRVAGPDADVSCGGFLLTDSSLTDLAADADPTAKADTTETEIARPAAVEESAAAHAPASAKAAGLHW